MARGPGTAQGTYRGDVFYYRVKCLNIMIPVGTVTSVKCGWTGYRAYPRWRGCPRCGGAVT